LAAVTCHGRERDGSRYTEASAKADIDVPEFQIVRSCVMRLCPSTPVHQDVAGSSPSRQILAGKGERSMGAFRCQMKGTVPAALHTRPLQIEHDLPRALTPHASRLTPHTSHLTPHTSHLTPHTSHLTPHTSHLTPHTSHLTPHTSHLTPHTSHLTPHTSRLTPHTSHLTPHTSHLTPHTSHLTPHAFCSPSASALSASPHLSFASASKLSSSVTKRSWMSGAVWAPSDAAADALALAWCPRPLPLSHKLCVLVCSSN
jgi:hypothetical protein